MGLFNIFKSKENLTETVEKDNSNSGFDKDNFIFTNFLSGVKGISLNTIVLLVNNISDNSLDLIYSTTNDEKDSKTIKLTKNTIRGISFNKKVRMQNIDRKVEENETKSTLLSAVVFGGNPLLQLAGNSGFNSLYESLSNNYNKVDYSAYYEIIIETSLDNQEVKLVLTSDTNPEVFIKSILSNEK